VAALGPDAAAKGLRVGDRVTLYYNAYCGKCHFCNAGKQHLCENIRVTVGFMAEYAVVDEQQVYKLPDDLTMRQGALAEPVSVCLHGVEMCRIRPGDTVAVSGGGGIGHICMQLARLSGGSRATLFEPVAWKREAARKAGAEHVLDPLAPGFQEAAMAVTDGRGFDVIIECSGAAPTIGVCYHLLSRGGTLELMALFKPEVTLDAIGQFSAMQKEATVIAGVFQSPYTLQRAVELLHRIDTGFLTASVFEPEQYAEAFAAQKQGKCMKSIFRFSREREA
jgi:(R,R)-butanediol dehydrogenase/meso-butanediol dehydrogenase/diacetyl reductase/L-iditol 2-dehydrogenase